MQSSVRIRTTVDRIGRVVLGIFATAGIGAYAIVFLLAAYLFIFGGLGWLLDGLGICGWPAKACR